MMFFSKSKRQKIAFLANCQGGTYKNLLSLDNEFKKKYEIIDLPLVHTLSVNDSTKIYQLAKQIDILFYQPLNSPKYEPFYIENLKKHMPFFSKKISIPVLYFNFQAPHTIYILPGKIESFKIEYHDINILLGWHYEIPTQEIYNKILSNDFYSTQLLQQIAEINFLRIEGREETLDIKYHTYLQENYQKEIMFNTFNHPKNELLLHVLSQIYDKLSLDTANMRIPTASLLGNIQTGIYPSIQAFCDTTKIPYKEVSQNYYIMKWKVFKEELDLSFMIEAYYAYYDMHRTEIKNFVTHLLMKVEDPVHQLIIDNFQQKK